MLVPLAASHAGSAAAWLHHQYQIVGDGCPGRRHRSQLGTLTVAADLASRNPHPPDYFICGASGPLMSSRHHIYETSPGGGERAAAAHHITLSAKVPPEVSQIPRVYQVSRRPQPTIWGTSAAKSTRTYATFTIYATLLFTVTFAGRFPLRRTTQRQLRWNFGIFVISCPITFPYHTQSILRLTLPRPPAECV